MFKSLKVTSVVDLQIKMLAILAGIAWVIFFSSTDYFIRVVTCIFIANYPCLFFAIGIYADKGWILSIMGIENDRMISQSKKYYLSFLQPSLFGALLFLLGDDNKIPFSLFVKSSAIVLGIYFALRTLTQVMGFYIYWIVRISKDTELKSNVPRDLILERSREAAKFNFRCAVALGISLLISLVTYFFAECIFTITSATRVNFILYAALLFIWLILFFVLMQTFDASESLLHISSQEEFEHEQRQISVNLLRHRLYFVKFLYYLFLFIEAFIILELFMNF